MNKSPSLAQITAGIRAVQTALGKHSDKTQKIVLKWGEERKYAAVEIGWWLLIGREVHIKAAGDRADNVSGRQGQDAKGRFQEAPDGFHAWLAANHPEIEERTAQRYMTAARNAGLTAESFIDEVKALRRKKALAGIPLAKLYQIEKEAELSPAEQFRQARIMAEIAFTHGRSGIVPRVQELVIEKASFAHLSPEQIELLYHTMREATDKIAAHRKPKVLRRAA